jgi:hypothetical protein
MMRKFSTDPTHNPGSWAGGNWEGRGYDIYAFFAEFPSGGKGVGDFEVDYQDVTADFWRITGQVHPIAILSFGQGNGPWEIEYNARNLASWTSDYQAPTQPTPAPPDGSVPTGYVRHSTLPCQAIADAIDASGLGINAWVDWNGDPGAFLCEYMAYHDGWYQSLHSAPNDPCQCIAAGFTHLAANVPVSNATQALEIALRTTINYLDSIITPKYSLTVTVAGNGSVLIDPNESSFDPDSQVTLTAIPGEGAEFSRWTGNIENYDNPVTITMDGNKNVIAVFTDNPVLIIDVVGDGYVQIEPNLPYYEWDSEVTLTAYPAGASSSFSKWAGDINDTNNPVIVVMNSDKHITAVFADSSVKLIDGESFEVNWPPAGWSITGEWTKNNDRASDGTYSAGFKHVGTPQWTLLTYDDFETGFGNYTDGGADCLLYTHSSGTNYAHQGSKAADIQNTGTAASFYYTNGVDVCTPGYTQIKIDFWFYPLSMEPGEDFFVEYYNGTAWQIVGQYISGTNFANGLFYHQTVYVNKSDYTFPTNMKIRFRCDASSAGDDIYIDEVRVEALSEADGTVGSGYLQTPLLDCSDSAETYVEFWYYNHFSDGNCLLQCFDGNSWNDIADLTALPTDQWNHYENTLTDSKYRTSNFRLRWLTSDVGNGQSFYIDMVTVKKTLASAPVIIQQPEDQDVWPGTTARFEVKITGTATISYIWQVNKGSNWQNIYSDGSAVLEVNEVNDNDIGSYRCFVSNEYGGVTSNSAALSFGDLDGTDPVNFKDFAILAANWGQGSPSLGDINQDNAVDIWDLVLLSRDWLCDFGQD